MTVKKHLMPDDRRNFQKREMAIVTSPQYTSLPPQTDSPCNLDGLESVLTGVDPFGNTLLHSAAAKEDGHLAEIPKLLQLGANVEAKNEVWPTDGAVLQFCCPSIYYVPPA